ncbi:MAG: outer membrane beta-barrel protein [Paludibacter sp.]|nr:outer membrane beta-barrel protein [Paludibacter sp.]
MKKTFRFRLLVALLGLTCILNAQTYRLEVGYNNPVSLGPNVSATYFNGIRLGGTVEFDLKDNFSLLTGVLYNIVYSNKIQKYPNLDTVTYKTLGHYLEIPLRLTYTLPITKNLKVFGFAGPNIRYGLSLNQEIISTMTDDLNTFNNIDPGKTDLYKNSIINRLNLQIGAGGGVQWKKYQLKGGYDFGITNLNKIDTGNLFQKGWYATFSYQF